MCCACEGDYICLHCSLSASMFRDQRLTVVESLVLAE